MTPCYYIYTVEFYVSVEENKIMNFVGKLSSIDLF